jgi:hypothetical protein
MKNGSKWLIGILMLLPHLMWAQSTSETALLFSRIKPGGSARIQGMGGVQTSLGGDYSSAFSNPAGLGMFNRSDISITPGFNTAKLTSNYLDNTTTETKTNLSIPGLGLVFQKEQSGRNGFLSGAFAVSFNRVNNFNQDFSYQGTNKNNSIIDYFIEDATGSPPTQFQSNGALYNTPTQLGYENYLIGDSTVFGNNQGRDSTQYFTDVLGIPFQNESIKTQGAQNQWNFSYGANFNDKIFIGVGVGFTSLRYETKKIYKEEFTVDPLSNLTLEENLRISGSGINANMGIIFRPMEMLQLGISYTTPTLYKLTDTYNANMSTQWNNYDYYYFDPSNVLKVVTLNDESWETEELLVEYDLRTPSHLNIGGTVFFQKFGFISADVEIVNYSGAKYSSGSSGISFESDNENIKALYQTTVNYRVGGEYRYSNYRARAGFAYMPDPFKSEQNGIDRKITTISGGLGYRAEKFYVDFALVFTQGENSYRPYRVNSVDSPLVTIQSKNTLALVTVGFPF